ncbi:hypothetical protein [Bacillus sp. mrc49]|uniref:hypothetical protein n=1 Tax=Bacillus sp. mrc49 TaxID=2054913 RepID=UPI000C27060C|nr:hypothetical protein [Bacillus sp. mrc49]PJN88404.1 hypothetical protein CVN76_20780 [Bacillus sp. mrc49]
MIKILKISFFILSIFVVSSCQEKVIEDTPSKLTIIEKEQQQTEVQNHILNYIRVNIVNEANKNNNLIDSYYTYGFDSKKIYMFYQYALVNESETIVHTDYFPVILKRNKDEEIISYLTPKKGEDKQEFFNEKFPDGLLEKNHKIDDEYSYTKSEIEKQINSND